mmetsp:Transcript_49670/g.124874  ORF Transcript_49670/g.124874 Transcript_49670/m.124874 type:complete len:189 (+) Transcript_49670:139-705(+)
MNAGCLLPLQLHHNLPLPLLLPLLLVPLPLHLTEASTANATTNDCVLSTGHHSAHLLSIYWSECTYIIPPCRGELSAAVDPSPRTHSNFSVLLLFHHLLNQANSSSPLVSMIRLFPLLPLPLLLLFNHHQQQHHHRMGHHMGHLHRVHHHHYYHRQQQQYPPIRLRLRLRLRLPALSDPASLQSPNRA